MFGGIQKQKELKICESLCLVLKLREWGSEICWMWGRVAFSSALFFGSRMKTKPAPVVEVNVTKSTNKSVGHGEQNPFSEFQSQIMELFIKTAPLPSMIQGHTEACWFIHHEMN